MSKNNPLRAMAKENKNYKLYKAKKQWITACTTFLIALGAGAVVGTTVQADTTSANGAANTNVEVSSTSASQNSAADKTLILASKAGPTSAAQPQTGTNDASEQADSSASASATSQATSTATKQTNAKSAADKQAASAAQSTANEGSSESAKATKQASTAESTTALSGSASKATEQTDDQSAASGATKQRATADTQAVSNATKQTADTQSAASEAVPSQSKESSANAESSAANAQSSAQSGNAKQATEDQVDQLKASQVQATADTHITPEAYTLDDGAAVAAGYQLTDADAVRFIKNAAELEKAGATFKWASAPTVGTQTSALKGETGSGTVVVTYKDGSTTNVPVEFFYDPQVSLSQLSQNGGYNFYYVKKVGDQVTSMDTADANGNVLYDANDAAHSLITVQNEIGAQDGDTTDFVFKLTQPLDTSTRGIHWAKVSVDESNVDNGAFGKLIGSYTIKVPYIVEGLDLKTDIPTDANGNPVINAQLASDASNTTAGFDPTAIDPSTGKPVDSTTLGQYFYQDYALAYALGVRTTVSDFTVPTDLVNTKTNSFKMTLSGLSSQASQTVDVNYVTAPKFDDTYFYNQGTAGTYRGNMRKNNAYVDQIFDGTDSNVNKLGQVTIDGQTYKSTSVTHSSEPNWRGMGTMGTWTVKLNVGFDNLNAAGQPLIFSNNSFSIYHNGTYTSAGSQDFVNSANQYTQDLYTSQQVGGALGLNNSTATVYTDVPAKLIALFPTEKNSQSDGVVDLTKLTDASQGNEAPEVQQALSKLVGNPTRTAGNMPTNQLPNGNTTWPTGTTFKFVDASGNDIVLNQAGQQYTGNIIVTLPSGSQSTVKDVTVTTKAELQVKNETVDYGTKLAAADLVTNKDVFPEGTTYAFVSGTEPDWNRSGIYQNVEITATYPLTVHQADGTTTTQKVTTAAVVTMVTNNVTTTPINGSSTSGNNTSSTSGTEITTDPANPTVAINGSRVITVMQGVDLPSIDSILNLPSDWASHTASWTTQANTNSTNEGTITVHYPDSNLDQTIDVYVNVIPKVSPVNGIEFNSDGSRFDGTTTGKIANGSDGTALTNATNGVSYSQYTKSGKDGHASTYPLTNTTVQPTMKISGLKTNSNGSLVSGSQTATIRVSVPAGTIGAQTDTNGSYYTISANIVVAQPVTFEFVDDDNNDSLVGDSHTQEFIPGQSTKLNFTMATPENYQLASGQTIPTSYTYTAGSATTVAIHLKHQTQSITDPTQTQQTRTLTVHYVNAKTGKSMGDLAPDAQLEVYYKRTVTKDLVTGQTTYGNWQWDTSRGDTATPGCHVISGTWTTPSTWSAVSVTVPTISGYQSFTTGDWEKNKDGSTSTVPTNEFSNPTYAGEQTTITGENSVAYTDDAPVYEAEAVHTVYYAPIQQESRTITEHYKKYNNGQLVDADVVNTANGQKQAYAQIQVHYQRTPSSFATNGSTDPTKWTINYGDWTFDTAAGDAATPGFTVLSGGYQINGQTNGQELWDLPTNTKSSWGINIPNLNGYTVANIRSDGEFSSFTIGALYNRPDAFTSATAGEWYYRNSLTTIYVPSSEFNKTVTRTISIQDPTTGQTRNISQPVTFTQTAKLNMDDDGVVFSGYKGTGTWPKYDLTKAGYTAIIDNQAATEVPSATVTPDTKDATVNVTYVQNAATVTISGSTQSKTYDGQPAMITDAIAQQISHQVNADAHLTLPTGTNQVKLTKDDFSIASEDGNILSGNPTNVGTYHIVLNAKGLAKFQKLSSNFTWTYDPQTSYVVYTINKAKAGSITFKADAQKTYDGSAVLNSSSFASAPSIVISDENGRPLAGLASYTFQSGDFEFVDAAGNVTPATIDTNGAVSGPVNVGTYTVRLTQSGLNRIEQANPNVDFSAIKLANTGSGTLTVNKYAPTLNLSGQGSKTYDGQTVTSAELIKSDSSNTIAIKLTLPKQGGGTSNITYVFDPTMDYTGDYDWYSNGQRIADPKDAGTYTIHLNADQVKTILEDLVNTDSHFSYLKGNLDLDNLQVTGQATYQIKQKPLTIYLDGSSSAVYTGSGARMPLADLIKHLETNGLVNGETLNTDTFDSADYQWYVKNADGTFSVFNGQDAQGNPVQTPINVGTYYIGILPSTSTNSGIETLQRDNPNYAVTVDYSKHYQFDITKAQGTVALSGGQTDTYNGQAHTVNGYTLTISGTGIADGQTVTLNAGDLEYEVNGQWTTAVPANVGTYNVRLSASKLTELANSYPNLSWTSDHVTNTATAYVVNPTQVQVSFNGAPNHVTYSGKDVSVDYVQAIGYLNLSGIVNGTTIQFPEISSDQFEWVDSKGNVMTSAPKDAGSYALRVKSLDGLNKLNPNYTFVFAKDQTGKDENGWNWVIDKAQATITFTNGSQSTPWTGKETVLDPNNFAVTISTNNGQTLTVSGLTKDDFQFYQNGQAIDPPTAVGDDYTIRLNARGLAKVEQDTENYTWTDDAVGSYEITKAVATITLNGSSSTTYNGQSASFPVNSDGSVAGISVTLSNGQTYKLFPGDLQFVDVDGHKINAPTDVGTYYVTLSETGLAQINQVDGSDYQYALNLATPSVKFTINKADATIALSGSGTHTYDGQAAKTSEGTYTIQLPDQTTPTTVDAGNLTFVDAHGHVIEAPTDAGTYSIALSDAYKAQLQNTYGKNYNLSYTNGQFTVDPQTVNLILNGYSSQIYNGQPAQVSDISHISLTWGDHTTTIAPGNVKFTLTPDDLVVVDGSGNTPSAANSADTSHPYYIHLKSSILSELNGQNKDYQFQIGDTYARYTIYSQKSNVDLTGAQYENYGSDTMPAIDAGNYTLTWTDAAGASHTIKLSADDLTVEVPTGTPVDANGLPLNAGQYAVKVKQSVIDNFNAAHPNYQLSNDLNTSAWYVVRHRQVAFTINNTPSSTYNGKAVQIKDGDYAISFVPVANNTDSGVISRDQAAFNQIKWDASDFEFVNGAPTEVGTYQVHLSAAGLKKLQSFAKGSTGSNYDFTSSVTIDNTGKFTASSVTANYVVNKNELTVALTNKDGKIPSSVIGNYDLHADDYTLTITPSEPIYGADGQPFTFTYPIHDSDLSYIHGTPFNANVNGRSYRVQLTLPALQKLEETFGTKNYSYESTTTASHKITPGKAIIAIIGGQTVTYTGQPAVLDNTKYVLNLQTNISNDSSDLSEDDVTNFVFYTKNADGTFTQLKSRPVNAGTYFVGFNEEIIKALKDDTGNNGNNFTWTRRFARYVIQPAKETATATFTNNSAYNAQPISDQTITFTTNYPGAKSTTYTLQKGDYEYVNSEGQVVDNPTDAGTYNIRLTAAGENHLKQLGNVVDASGNITTQNVDWTINFNGSYTISPVRMTVTVSGTQNVTYNGQPQTINIGGTNGVNVTLSDDGLTVPTIPTTGENALTAADFTIRDDQGNVVTQPTNAGHYKIYLNASGLAKLGQLSPNFTVPESLDQSADLNIARQDVNVAEGKAGKTFDAQSAALTDAQFAQYKKAITDAGYSADGLTIDGIDWWFDDSVDYGLQGSMANPIKDIGTYNLRLNAKGQAELDAANPNYKIKVSDFQYTIYPEVVHIEVSGTQSSDWDNQSVAVDPTHFVPQFVVYGGADGKTLITNPVRDDGQPLTLPAGVQLEPGDYEFVDSQGNVISSFKREDGTSSANPFKAGSYKVRLTESGWQKLATQSTDNVKYQYDGSTGTLTINQITPEVKLNGANWKDYDGQPVSYEEVTSKDPTTHQALIYVSLTSNGRTIILPLKEDDFIWASNGQALTSAPSAAGTYTIVLNKANAINDLNAWVARHPDYQEAMKFQDDKISGSALFEIRSKSITKIVASPDTGSKTYDGQASRIDLGTLSDSFKATDDAGHVWKLNTDNLTLADYTVTDANGHVVTKFPVNVGTYIFKLNSKGISDLAAANPNFTIPSQINGYSYTFTINPAEAKAVLGGQAGKTYDGQQVTTAEVNAGTSTVTVSINANKTVTYVLQDGDYDWFDKNGNKLDHVPTDAGSYTIKLNINNVLKHLQDKIDADPEWTVDNGAIHNVILKATDLSGQASFTIAQKPVNLIVAGTQTSTTPTVNPQNFTVSGDGITISGLTANDFQLIDSDSDIITSPKSGQYGVTLTNGALARIQEAHPNYHLNFMGTGLMTLQAELTINFVDTDDGNQVVQSTKYDQLADALLLFPSGSLQVPAGYQLAAGQTLPTYYVFTDALQQTMTINLKHQKVTVTPTTASTDIPTGQVPGGHPGQNFAPIESLDNAPTRTIKVTTPDGTTNTTSQRVEFTRNATFDMVTGDITYTPWTRQGEESGWPSFAIAELAGYTILINGQPATTDQLAAITNVSATTTSQTVNISYQANSQKLKINFVDDNESGKQVETVVKTGKTGQTITSFNDVKTPEHYQVASGQVLPMGYTFTADKDQTITIHLVHATETVDGKNPDAIPNEVKDDLIHTVTRTITDHVPGQDPVVTKQTATITRSATYDEVTGKLSNFSPWTKASLAGYQAQGAAGYTPSQAQVAAEEVTDQTQSSSVDITYAPNTQTGKISYVDENGKEIGTTPLSGKTGQHVAITPIIPDGYVEVPGQTIPASVTASADGIPTVTVKVLKKQSHSGDPLVDHKDVLNIINYVDENGKTVKTEAHSGKVGDPITITIPDGYHIDGSTPVMVISANDPVQTVNVVKNSGHSAEPTVDHKDVLYIVDYKDNQSGQIIKSDPLTGKSGDTINVKYVAPTGWQIVNGDQLPSHVTFNNSDNPEIVVLVDHATQPIHDSKTITRTINVTDPKTDHVTTTTQQVTLNRDGTHDEVTKADTWGAWSTGKFDEVHVPAIAGYTPSQSTVPSEAVNSDTKDETIDITYTANAQTGKISYVGPDGKEVANTPLSGKTGEKVNVTPQIPAHWVVDSGQNIPATVTATANGIPTVTIHIHHATDQIHDSKTITRTINVTDPKTGHVTTTTQQVTLTRDGTHDEVTNADNWGAWTTGSFAQVDVPAIAGYTPSQSTVPAETVTSQTQDSTVNVSYVANEQTTHINYVDGNGNVIKTDTITGRTGQTVRTNSTVPAGWQLAAGAEVPATITFNVNGTPDVTVRIEHATKTIDHNDPVKPGARTESGQPINGATQSDLTKTVTRTVNITDPVTGRVATTRQSVELYRDASIDEVTGAVTYGNWSTGQFVEVVVPQIKGYTPSQATVPAAAVDSTTPDSVVNVSYTVDEHTVTINYVDQDGHVIKTDAIHGKIGQRVALPHDLPAGWTIIGNLPTSIVIRQDVTLIAVEIVKRSPSEPVNPGQSTQPTQPAQPQGGSQPGQAQSTGKATAGQSVVNASGMSAQPTAESQPARLPQTGNNQNRSAALLGLGLLTTLLGMLGLKKRRHD